MDHITNGHGPDGDGAAGERVATDVHERARQGVEHLQAAARELIQAARAALDVAEELVNDPEAVASLAGVVTTFGDLARRVTGTGSWPPAAHSRNGGADEADSRVERITVR
ncbi:MAG TPA: hypothetical protein VFB77_09825 [Acidimicrobiales bacterium]|nr:hypothetical protein [Acidimicrobiales bacterium]